MILRLGLTLLLALWLGLAARPVAAQTPITPVSIDVEGRQIVMAPADADAFQRRLNLPPLLTLPPAASGPSYTVTTAYWAEAVRARDSAGPPAAPEAEYFPAGGFVRTNRDGQDAWIVLDLRQRALLDRYIRYATENPSPPLVDPNPGALLVVFLKAFGVGEEVGIEAGDRRLDPDEARRLWESVAPWLSRPVFLDPPQPPQTGGADGYWLTFTLPEGRALLYFLDPSAGSLTDALGTESYDIGNAAGGGILESASARPIEHQEPVGSALWWLLAVAGVSGLLGLGFWLRRRGPGED